MAETGHARNVANFDTLIAFCEGYGGDYKPTNTLIEIPALQTLLAQAQAALDDVQAKLAPWKNKVADRENVYEGIRPLTTQVLAAFDACGAAENKVDNMKTFQRQVHGARAKALPPDDPSTPEDESKGNSVSHQSYVQVAEAFSQMIQIAQAEPLYHPNETPLQVATLQTRLTAMETANTDVTDSAVPLSNSRIDRNDVLYDSADNLCDRAGLVKKYVKSLYGASSPQYEQVSGLEFKRR
ncbi:MAG: hypothetical protein KBD94_04460 [Pyrinomonadaceae bacterium]|nr:hypothetical protein [Pyrinomonadaceae bacterium]